MPDGIEPEPEDVPPEREQKEKTDVTTIDSEDEDDEDDAPPAPFEAPPGFSIATSPPTAEQLELKVASSVDALVGRHSLFKWPVVGWCVGRIMHRNHDARSFKLFEGERVKVNFIIFYEIDQQSVKTALRMEDYRQWRRGFVMGAARADHVGRGPRRGPERGVGVVQGATGLFGCLWLPGNFCDTDA
jgi:hypothetical protein